MSVFIFKKYLKISCFPWFQKEKQEYFSSVRHQLFLQLFKVDFDSICSICKCFVLRNTENLIHVLYVKALIVSRTVGSTFNAIRVSQWFGYFGQSHTDC